ncbi:hypothetical protein AB0O14_00190 [Microbacterium foliorum]
MTRPSHRPKVLPEGVRVETSVPFATGEAIELLASMSGTNKRTVLRNLIHAGLEPYRLLSPEVAAALPTTTYKKEN